VFLQGARFCRLAAGGLAACELGVSQYGRDRRT
jgi:hypothetical protein